MWAGSQRTAVRCRRREDCAAGLGGMSGLLNVFQVARLVGHARVQTTLRYDRRKLQRLRAIVELLAVPLFDGLSERARWRAAV